MRVFRERFAQNLFKQGIDLRDGIKIFDLLASRHPLRAHSIAALLDGPLDGQELSQHIVIGCGRLGVFAGGGCAHDGSASTGAQASDDASRERR